MPEPIHVSAGFGWTAAGAWAAAAMLLGIIVRQVNPWRKIRIEADEKLREDLLGRVDALEKTLARERVHRDAERALDRHRLNNVTQCLDALLMLLEAAPEKSADAVRKIKEMRAVQLKAEAVEKSAIHAAEIAASAEVQV